MNESSAVKILEESNPILETQPELKPDIISKSISKPSLTIMSDRPNSTESDLPTSARPETRECDNNVDDDVQNVIVTAIESKDIPRVASRVGLAGIRSMRSFNADERRYSEERAEVMVDDDEENNYADDFEDEDLAESSDFVSESTRGLSRCQSRRKSLRSAGGDINLDRIKLLSRGKAVASTGLVEDNMDCMSPLKSPLGGKRAHSSSGSAEVRRMQLL
jgi:hypothetical protein